MKRVVLSLALVAMLGISVNADETFVLNQSDTLAAGESISGTFDKGAGIVDSISVSFDYDEPISDGSWASDARFQLSNGVVSIDVGGFSNPVNDPAGWAFDGGGSTAPGFYSDTFGVSGDGSGTWSWTFTNDWDTDPNANVYSNVTVTITHAIIPEPTTFGVIALGTVGMFLRRRR